MIIKLRGRKGHVEVGPLRLSGPNKGRGSHQVQRDRLVVRREHPYAVDVTVMTTTPWGSRIVTE